MPQSFGNYLCSRWLQLLCTRCCPLNRQGPQINGKLARRKKGTTQTTSKTNTHKKQKSPPTKLKTWKKHQRLPARFHALSIHANLQWENIWDHKLGSQCRLPQSFSYFFPRIHQAFSEPPIFLLQLCCLPSQKIAGPRHPGAEILFGFPLSCPL